MHGRPRKPAKTEDEAVAAAQATKLRTLQSQFLHNHHHKIYDEEAMKVSAKLLEINPEYYTAWNYRKLAVEHHLNELSNSDSCGPDSVQSILNHELDVATASLKRNFKSYGAWHHRKWVLSRGHLSLDKELRLINLFQEADSRNFHAWNHRRFVAVLMNSMEIDEQKYSEIHELKYTQVVIERNLSNYSAWHNRSVILSSLFKRKAEGFYPKEKILNEEYELVHNAIFTDPDDQSGWFYYLWLLEQTINLEAPLVISSWPAPGSELLLSVNGSVGTAVSPFANYLIDTRTFPVILYFSQPVKGVNSSTVTVKSALKVNGGLFWRPLSRSKDSARAWVAYIDVSNAVLGLSERYPVHVRCEHSEDITSLNGFHCSHGFVFEFTVRIQLLESRDGKEPDIEMISWKDCEFQKYAGDVVESNPFTFFHQLRMDTDQEAIASKWSEDILVNEIALLRDLLAESDCKIGKLMLARLLTAVDAMLSNGTSSYSQMPYSEEILQLYSDLVTLDPPHLQFYKDQRSLAFFHQVTSSRETLLSHCWHYRDSSILHGGKLVSVRLNNLSLTQIGSIEHLMWVQMLDLSYNALRSISGLEAMQVLSCLNLSNNYLSSFTALDPLRQLKSLKVLDISHNEIGGHPIDTTRYLCSSPLSHTATVDCKYDTLPVDDDIAAKHWEAVFLFKDMNLTQLDIARNPVVDEDLMLLLRNLLPKLRWLDGHSLVKI